MHACVTCCTSCISAAPRQSHNEFAYPEHSQCSPVCCHSHMPGDALPIRTCGWPLMRMSPVMRPWFLRPAMTSMNVVLPAPLAPTSNRRLSARRSATGHSHQAMTVPI